MTGAPGRAAGTEPGRLVSVNVGVARPVSWRDRIVHTAIFKYP